MKKNSSKKFPGFNTAVEKHDRKETRVDETYEICGIKAESTQKQTEIDV